MNCYLFYIWILHSFISVCNGVNEIIVSDTQSNENNSEVKKKIENVSGKEAFVPTKEWQVVKEEQAIPAGLHIRMDFQTGVKEAKLMDDAGEDANNKTPKVLLGDEISTLDREVKNSKEKLYFTKTHLKEALKDFRDKVGTKNVVDDITWSDDAKEALQEISEEDQERVRKKFRSMEEIRAELEDKMGWKMKSDVEAMKERIQLLYDENNSIDQKAAALDGLEDYVHQIDNAGDLDKIGGMEVLVKLLNDSNEVLQEKAANVIGAATQNNELAQNAALSYNALKFLLRMVGQEKSAALRKKGLFALSAMIRGNYGAQKEFQKLNGFETVINIMNEMSAGIARLKAIVLINDLIVEQNNMPDGVVPIERPDWSKSLIQSNWCSILKPLLDTSDYDTKEKLLQAIYTSLDVCSSIFQSNNIAQKLSKQMKLLKKEIENETDEDFKSYLRGLLTQMKDIINKIQA